MKNSITACAATLLVASVAAQQKKPNILFISADDLGNEFVGYAGNTTPDITPNLDNLASQSVHFVNGFITDAISQPSRSVWITGCYPHRNGATGFNPVVQPRAMLGEQMRKSGYHTGIFGKGVHYLPGGPEHWDDCVLSVKGSGRDASQFALLVKESIENAKKEHKPFFIHANAADPHRPFSKSRNDVKNAKDPSRIYTPQEVMVPGYLCDVPETRQELAYYCNSVRRLDDVVGSIMAIIDSDSKLRDNTIVIFASDNGAPLPFGKGSCYLQSDKTPLIVRMNGLKPRKEKAYVNGIDMMPTILDMASAKQPEHMDGKSFLGVLKGGKDAERNHVHTVYHRNQDMPTEQRAIHNDNYGYIYNEWRAWEPQRSIVFIADNNISIFGAAQDPVIAARKEFYMHRAPEELYDYAKDPYSLINLADDPKYISILNEMRNHMEQWMYQTGDYAQPGYTMFIEKKIGEKRRNISSEM